jgi:hypothetical protein
MSKDVLQTFTHLTMHITLNIIVSVVGKKKKKRKKERKLKKLKTLQNFNKIVNLLGQIQLFTVNITQTSNSPLSHIFDENVMHVKHITFHMLKSL